MNFNRIIRRELPDGSLIEFFPYHVCTEGHEDRNVCQDEEDLRVAQNFIAICAKRADVIISVFCVLNTHIHSIVLAPSIKEATRFIESYKISYSKYYSKKYGGNKEIYNTTKSTPILIDDDRYLRNAICYTLRNALDTGHRVDNYKWSSYRSLFKSSAVHGVKISELKYRDRRAILKTGEDLSKCNWLIDNEGVILPESFCYVQYAEAAFYNNHRYFLRCLGLTDDAQMEQKLVTNNTTRCSTEDIMLMAKSKSRHIYGKELESLTTDEKIPILKIIRYSMRASEAQLSRCFEMHPDKIHLILQK